MIEPVQSDAAFLADIERATRELPEKLHLWWLGQSGYLVRHRQTTLLIDPYLSDSLTSKYMGTAKPHVRISRRVVDPGEVGKALGRGIRISSSHPHTDHLDPDTLRPLLSACEYASVVVPEAQVQLAIERTSGAKLGTQLLFTGLDDGKSEEGPGLATHAIASAHDKIDRDKKGHCKYLGYVFDIRIVDSTLAHHSERLPVTAYRIYHSGDTVVYNGLADRVRALGPIDIAILPINGKVGNMGGREAARLAKEIGAKLVIPCHYDLFEFNTADPREEFIPECERIGQAYRVLQLGERLTV